MSELMVHPPGGRPHLKPTSRDVATRDSFQNFLTKTGINAGNQASGGHYGFNPITRNRMQCEWCYRGSWIFGNAVDVPAEDMTRAGVDITTSDKPERLEEFEQHIRDLMIWKSLADVIRWGRLYGGAIGIMMIEGQDPSTPLNTDSIGKDQFKGIIPLDRWAVQPDLSDIVGSQPEDEKLMAHLRGLPRYYHVLPAGNQWGLPEMKVHYSRAIRAVGVELPLWQRTYELYWGQSVIERLWDRLLAYDSTTNGAAQMAYKAHLRVLKIKGLRDIVAAGGPIMDGLVKQIEMMRLYQSNEGISLVDAEDEFDVHQYGFAGLNELLSQFGEQLSGALGIPITKLFGQSPGGMNATGESDIRNYYDGLNRKQETELRGPVEVVYELAYRSKFGSAPPKSFAIKFAPLWQLSDQDAANIVNQTAAAVCEAFGQQIIDKPCAQRELRALGKKTGAFSNITDEMIDQAEEEAKEARENPPTPEQLGLPGIEQPPPGSALAVRAGKGGLRKPAKPGREIKEAA